MENSGTIKPSISLPITLWNDIQSIITNDEQSFSRFMQSAARLKIKAIKKQNAREYLDSIDEYEMNILKEEIKKRSR